MLAALIMLAHRGGYLVFSTIEKVGIQNVRVILSRGEVKAGGTLSVQIRHYVNLLLVP